MAITGTTPLKNPLNIPVKKRDAIKVLYEGINFEIIFNIAVVKTNMFMMNMEFFLPK